jgi:hypothetical protein
MPNLVNQGLGEGGVPDKPIDAAATDVAVGSNVQDSADPPPHFEAVRIRGMTSNYPEVFPPEQHNTAGSATLGRDPSRTMGNLIPLHGTNLTEIGKLLNRVLGFLQENHLSMLVPLDKARHIAQTSDIGTDEASPRSLAREPTSRIELRTHGSRRGGSGNGHKQPHSTMETLQSHVFFVRLAARSAFSGGERGGLAKKQSILRWATDPPPTTPPSPPLTPQPPPLARRHWRSL